MAARITISLVTGLALLFGLSAAQAESPLEGAWIMQAWVDEDGSSTDSQRGLWVFTGNHYSAMFISTPESRPLYEGEESDEHKLVAYDGFVANSGRYEVEGNVLKTRAYVAKDTNYMGNWPENEVTYEFEVDGDTLTLRSLTFAIEFEAMLRQVEGTPNPWDGE